MERFFRMFSKSLVGFAVPYIPVFFTNIKYRSNSSKLLYDVTNCMKIIVVFICSANVFAFLISSSSESIAEDLFLNKLSKNSIVLPFGIKMCLSKAPCNAIHLLKEYSANLRLGRLVRFPLFLIHALLSTLKILISLTSRFIYFSNISYCDFENG